MRRLESYIIYLAAYAVWHGTSAPFTFEATIALAGVLLAHFVLERPRWQLTLAYLLSSYLIFSIVISSSSSWPAGWLFLLASYALLGVASAFACLFPVAVPPALAGPYKTIGVEHRFISTVAVKGDARTEMRGRSASTDLHAHAEIGLHVFYPSSLDQPTKAGLQFMTPGETDGLSSFLEIPSFFFGSLPLGRLRAIEGVPIVSKSAEEKLPWVVLSHGLGGCATMYAAQCSELASQGYVVFAPTHTDGSACLAELRTESIAYSHRTTEDFTPEDTRIRSSQLRTRAAEVEHIINVVFAAESGSVGWSPFSTAPSVPPPFAGRIDLDRLALVGHSFGGATVSMAASNDQRVKAVITHDMWIYPLVHQEPATAYESGTTIAPTLATISDQWVNFIWNHERLPPFIQRSKEGTLVLIDGIRHSNYSDVPMFSQLLSRKKAAIGRIDFRLGMAIINRVQVAWLARHMRGERDAFKTIVGNAIAKKQVSVLVEPKSDE